MGEHQPNRFFLNIKLAIPPPRSSSITRFSLLQRLQTAIAHPLTLIAAPAGFGKTTLLCAWAQHSTLPIGWVSLDSSDNDVTQFWTYVITALDRLYSGCGTASLALLQRAQPAPIETVLTTLINALSGSESPLTLILDDYHVIEMPAIHQALLFLLDHLPPPLHLVLASRTDPPLPLSRLRVRGQLAELRIDDLRFTQDEAAAFLQHSMGLSLTPNDIAALETRTEGWVAGLQLAALSMQHRKDTTAFVTAFAGSHRYIVDYLTEEVLKQQPAQLRTFLLYTSILERLNGSLCDAVTNQNGSQMLLEQLEQANLFLIPLDEARLWYRYHHLFAGTLRYYLGREHSALLPILHQRASIWLERNGFPLEAVQHALDAQDFPRVATLIEPLMNTMIERGAHAMVKHWLDVLPDDVLLTRPSLCMWFAWAALFVGDIDAYQRPLNAAEQTWRAENNSHGLGQVYTFRASVAQLQSDPDNAIQYAQQALLLLSEDDFYHRGSCSIYLGASYFMLGNLDQATTLLTEARNLCQRGNIVYGRLYATNYLSEVEVAKGKLHVAMALSREVLAAIGDHPNIHASLAHTRLGSIYREMNDLPQAQQHMQQAVLLGEQAGQQIYMSATYLALASLHWTLGKEKEAYATLAQAVDSAQQLKDVPALAHAQAMKAQFDVARGNIEAARQWSTTITPPLEQEPIYEHESEYLTLARLWIAQGQLKPAAVLLQHLKQADETAGRVGNLLQVLVLLAIVQQQANDEASALHTLEHALVLAMPENYRRVFVDEGTSMLALLHKLRTRLSKQQALQDYMQQLVAAFALPEQTSAIPTTPSPPTHAKAQQPITLSPASSSLLEPLSNRELAVLTLLANGMANAEIAAHLVVTVGTVKTHIKSIYGKLGVHSRTQAIARARELQLL